MFIELLKQINFWLWSVRLTILPCLPPPECITGRIQLAFLSLLMRRTIRLVVVCSHERICIHAHHRGLWRRRGGWKGRVRMRAYLPRCTLQSVWKGRGERGGSFRCWIAYLRSQSPPFARALSPLRGPAMDVTPGCAFFIIFLHFQHADTLYIANSIGT